MAWQEIPQVPGYEAENNGNIKYTKTNVEVAQILGKDYKLWVKLLVDGRDKWFEVGELVAFAFIGTPLPNQILNHIDGDMINNRRVNLEWV